MIEQRRYFKELMMLCITIPKNDLEQLSTGVEVKINGEPVVIRKAGEFLVWNDHRRLILDVQDCCDDNGVECASFVAE
jgi:hypothetical protein